MLDTLINQLSKTEGNATPSYLPALEFLKNAGQIEMVQQTEQVSTSFLLHFSLHKDIPL